MKSLLRSGCGRAPTPVRLSALVALSGLWLARGATAVEPPLQSSQPEQAAPSSRQAAANDPAPVPQKLPQRSGPLTVVITASSPLLGSGVNADQVPTMTHVLSSRDMSTDGGPPSLTNALMDTVGSVNVDSTFGNPYQPDITYRGFIASPVVGVPQGFAVYVNGVRANEAFGDTVNWDLIPDFAIDTMDLSGTNPVFGLNALGGAVVIGLKDGFHFQGLHADVSAGSFGRVTGIAEYGARFASNWGFYFGAERAHENGWRVDSPSSIRKLYSDLGYDNGQQSLHLSASYADNELNAMGPTPLSFFSQGWGTGVDYPGESDNSSYTTELRGLDQITDATSIETEVYYRHFHQYYVNGTILSAQECADGDGDYCVADGSGNYTVPLLDQYDRAVPTSDLNGVGAGPDYPSTDAVSYTRTNTVGGTVQGTSTARILGRDNHFVAGVSLDRAATNFAALSQLGVFNEGRWDVPAPEDLYVVAPGVLYNVGLESESVYWGAYFSDTLDVTRALAVTASGRYNLATLDLHDELGGDLTGDHRYDRFNPSLGLTYALTPRVTAFADYAESNRIPSPAELSCANPEQSCSLASFFVADPNLRQVVARTWEAGVRGRLAPSQGSQIQWDLDGFRTVNADDIIEVASSVIGRGYFRNDGTTQREGMEAGLDYHASHWRLHADYSFVAATFQSYLTLESPFNPFVSAAGTIEVHPGDTIPGVPRQRVKLVIDRMMVGNRLDVGASWMFVSSQVLVGDESNRAPPVPAYTELGLHAQYAVNASLQIYATASNVLDRHYFVSGTYTDISGLPGTSVASTATYVPAAPFGLWAGLRCSF